MKKPLFILCLSAVVVIGFIAVSKQIPVVKKESKKIAVVTTLFPLYDFAKNLGQDKVAVSLLMPPGVEVHSFEPKPSDIARIGKADVFVYTGKRMEPWAEDIIKASVGKTVTVVDASIGTRMIPALFRGGDAPKGALDPHIWLDFDNAKTMVDTITQAFSGKDPVNGNFYQQKAAEYKNLLTALDSEYKATLSTCKNKVIVYGGHYAFGYLANRYGLQYLAAQGISPDAEPTAHDLVKLVTQIKKTRLKYVFYEELTSPKIAETISNETETRMLLLNAAHNLSKNDFENKLTFFSIMKNNLKSLTIGLECSE